MVDVSRHEVIMADVPPHLFGTQYNMKMLKTDQVLLQKHMQKEAPFLCSFEEITGSSLQGQPPSHFLEKEILGCF